MACGLPVLKIPPKDSLFPSPTAPTGEHSRFGRIVVQSRFVAVIARHLTYKTANILRWVENLLSLFY